jgi:O-antigen/teichoic acid export membrane protein
MLSGYIVTFLQSRVLRSRLTTNTLILLTSSSGSAVLSFVLTALIARATGQVGLGVYAAALAWVFPVSLITEFGLGTLITREVAQQPALATRHLRAAVQARLLIGGTLMLILWLLAPLLSVDERVVVGIQLSAPLVVILPFFSAFSAIFRAYQRMLPIALLNIGMLLAQVGLTALVFLAGGGVLLAIIVNTLTSAGQLIAAWGVYRYIIPQPVIDADKREKTQEVNLFALLRQAAPFAIAAVLAAIQMRLNLILLEGLTSIAEVGYYAAALKFIEAVRLLPMAFFDALFPRLALLAAHPAQLKRTFRYVAWGLAGFGLVSGLMLFLLAPFIITWVYGATFQPAVTVLQIMAFALPPLLLKQARILYWYALRKETFVNQMTSLGVVIQVITALWLIPYGRADAAALVMLCSEIFISGLLWFL